MRFLSLHHLQQSPPSAGFVVSGWFAWCVVIQIAAIRSGLARDGLHGSPNTIDIMISEGKLVSASAHLPGFDLAAKYFGFPALGSILQALLNFPIEEKAASGLISSSRHHLLATGCESPCRYFSKLYGSCARAGFGLAGFPISTGLSPRVWLPPSSCERDLGDSSC